VYFEEKVNAGVRQAGWVVLSLVRVEWRIFGNRQSVEQLIQG
jgi:hypothetical protein